MARLLLKALLTEGMLQHDGEESYRQAHAPERRERGAVYQVRVGICCGWGVGLGAAA